jgi:hypothetical protein
MGTPHSQQRQPAAYQNGQTPARLPSCALFAR